ncbi:MAG: succinate dehydrogenase cytochrome b subunit [bacterium]|nr:succinate dehydrogenase cytochrome b subunit [bacterium]
MSTFRSHVWSSVGKKMITGLTGLMLVGFVAVHLLGNLTLFIPDRGHAFNAYAYFLEHAVHGWLILAFEAGLLAVFGFHIVSAITVAWTDKRKARPVGYALVRNAGGKSRKGLPSTSMIVTGLSLAIFVILHVKMFKFADHPAVVYDGKEMKDLYAVVVAAFKQPLIAGAYVAVMGMLGFHLRHGFWSAFQSLGWNNDRAIVVLENLARVVAVLFAVGFLVLPLYILFFVDPSVSGGHR